MVIREENVFVHVNKKIEDVGTVDDVSIRLPTSIPNSIFLFQFPIAKYRPPFAPVSLSLAFVSLSAFGDSFFFSGFGDFRGDSKSSLLIWLAASIFRG